MEPRGRSERSTRLLPRGVLARVVVRATVSSVSLVAVYYLAPLDGTSTATAIGFVVGLATVAGLVGWQVRAVLSAPYPLLRSIEALAIIMPFYVLLWSVAVVVLSRADPSAFSEVLDRTGALYFTMSVLATVGFGDVVAVTGGARALLTVQMVGNLVLVGVVVRLFVAAADLGRSMREHETDLRG